MEAPIIKTYRMRIQMCTYTNKRIKTVTFQRRDFHENTYKPTNFIVLHKPINFIVLD